ncbi:DUF2290 domain-containing protein [Agrobacterium genomosp. 3]|uniref:DUF2290 domain-containing protein n=1 Tax=Agrobacterium tomkonis TaxID=1183410 RepID=UPI001CD87766|nr:DUF2290 domain-containing protein [Agrobacterium tomkonis]MCA1877972.1 DUF2290 domain-containing protein [Agrobacterium tumefaciens]MCA1893197.1 DUF2290 domain-containing protein [Agrobacterium tomkonis]
MSALDFCRSISTFCETLLEKGLAISLQSHVVQPLGNGINRVSWVSSKEAYPDGSETRFSRTLDLEFGEYLRCLREGDYSLLLNDGGLLQVSLDFRSDTVIASRFCYIPCSIKFDLDELRMDEELYPIEDFILELPGEELLSRLCIRPPFRFEHDPVNASEKHALNHVHIGKTATRIPVSAAMCWDHFARFVFSNFYSETFPHISPLLRFPVPYREKTISEPHGQEVHFSFDSKPPSHKADDDDKGTGRKRGKPSKGG